MSRYQVLIPIKLAGERVPPGQTVDLDDARAAELLAVGAIKPASAPARKEGAPAK
jgi:hypothetical protein